MSSQEDEEPPRALNNMYDGSASDISETAEERFQRNKAEARRVWLSGFFCGRSYAPDPAEGEDDELSASAQEEALTEPTYVVPRGYKYRTSTVPAILAPIPTGMLRASYLIYAILATVAWVFLLISSTPIPWFHGKDKTVDGINFKNVKYTLWKRTGGDLPDLHVGDMDACPIQKHFFQTISVCMILGCVFTFFSVLAAVSRVRGGSTYGSALILGFVGFVWAIAGNSMSLSQYFGSACGAPRLSDSTSLDAGFALSLVAWIFLFAGLLLMAFATKLNVGPALKQIRVVDTYYLLLITVALLFTVVANAGTVWKRHFGTDLVKEVRVTYWHTELTMADDVPIRYGRRMYRCLAYTKRMKASISFLILSSIFLLFTALFAIPAFSRPPMRKVTCVFAIIAEIFLTISWVTAVAVFHMETCSVSTANTKFADYPGVPSGVYQGETKFTGYGLQEGVVLSIVAWILILVAVFINKYFP